MPFANRLPVKTYKMLQIGLVSLMSLLTVELNAGQQDQSVATDDEIRQMIRQLSADRFAERQAAMRALIEIGREVIEPIELAIHDGEPEMRMRSMAVLQRLSIDRDADTQAAAQSAIERLLESDDGDIQRLAMQTMSQLAGLLQDSAINTLQGLGADIQSNSSMLNAGRAITLYTITIPEQWSGTKKDLKLLRWTRDVNFLTLIGGQIDDEVVDYLTGIDRLQTLVIKRASISNSSIETIAQMRSLSALQLVYCEIDDNSLPTLEKMNQLTTLQLFGTKVSSDAATQLANKLNIAVDLRKGAFLGVFYNREGEICEITRVVSGSSADEGGILAGDIIVGFGDRTIETGKDFQAAVSEYDAGEEVEVAVVRSGQRMELKIQLGRFMDDETLR